VHFHFTPTRTSWLNQIETRFSRAGAHIARLDIAVTGNHHDRQLGCQRARAGDPRRDPRPGSGSGASFTAVSQLQEHIDAFVSAWQRKAEPFIWSKKKVRQRRFKGTRSTQL
jgi:hypothetical protein